LWDKNSWLASKYINPHEHEHSYSPIIFEVKHLFHKYILNILHSFKALILNTVTTWNAVTPIKIKKISAVDAIFLS